MSACGAMKAFSSAFVYGLRRPIASRGTLLFVVLLYGVIITAMTSLWHAAMPNGKQFAGYSLNDLTWYIVFTEAVVFGVEMRRIETISNEVNEPSFDIELLRPVSPLLLRVAAMTGEAFVRTAVVLPVGLAIAFIKVGAPERAGSGVVALLSAILGVVLSVLMVHVFASSAFWLGRLRSGWLLYQKLVFLPGGMMLPLELYPHWFQNIAFALPFWMIAYAPGSAIAGHSGFEVLMLQAIAVLMFGFIASACFRLGIRAKAKAT